MGPAGQVLVIPEQNYRTASCRSLFARRARLPRGWLGLGWQACGGARFRLRAEARQNERHDGPVDLRWRTGLRRRM